MSKKKGDKSTEIDTISRRIICILKDSSEESLSFSEIFQAYKKKFKCKPDPQTFGVNKRSLLLKHIDGIIVNEQAQSARFVKKSVKPPAVRGDSVAAVRADSIAAVRADSIAAGIDQEDLVKATNSVTLSETLPAAASSDMKRHRQDILPGNQHNILHGNQHAAYQMNYPTAAHAAGYDVFRQAPPMQAPPMQAPPMQAPPHMSHPHGYNQQHMHSRHRQQSGDHLPPSKKIYISKDQLDQVAKDCIERLAESKKYVSLQRIEKLLLEHYKVTDLNEINIRQIEHIQSVNNHVRCQAKVTAYIQAFIKTRAIATLHELDESLKLFVADGKEFETLNLGPLSQQPVVYYVFKFPPEDCDIPELTTADILQYLRDFLTEKNLWTAKSDLQDFMAFMTEKRQLDSPYHLGVRLTSLALAIQVLKRAQRDTGQAVRNALITLNDMAEADVNKAFSNFTVSVLNKDPGICVVRQEYFRMKPKQLMDAIFKKLNVLYASINYLNESSGSGNISNKKSIKDARKTQEAMHSFLSRMQHDKLLQGLFQVAICCSTEDIHLQLHDILGLGNSQQNHSALPETQQSSAEAMTAVKPPLHHIISKIKHYLERCHGILNMSNLARVESKILEDFNFPHFHALGPDSFLKLMAENVEIKKYLEESGSVISGGSSGGRSSYLPSSHDLAYFVWQSGIRDPSQLHSLEDALCYHYGSADVKSLGHGSAAHIIQKLERNTNQGNSCIMFEGAMVAKASNGCLVRGRKVGIFGHQTKDRALACLQNCPLLEDMHEWSHWDMVFEPELGDICDFVEKYGGVNTMPINDNGTKAEMSTTILALETRPGTLLRITADTSPDKMAAAAQCGDVRATCGHLVSLIVANKGVQNTGLALLGNHVKTAIVKMQADVIPGGPSSGASKATMFVLDCLTLLPKLICVGVAQKVFLGPLSEVVGQTKSRDLMLSLATSPSTLGRLQVLGFMLGLENWSQSFRKQLEPPIDSIHRLDITGLEDIIPMEEEEDDDDDDDDDESEGDSSDSSTILSDLEDLQNESDQDGTEMLEEKVKSSEQDDPSVDDGDVDMPIDIVRSVSVAEDNSCLDIINQIRSEEFGVDVVLSEDGQRLMVKQQERLGRSLDRLSKDLYSKDTHFVLELVQNADDNDYPDLMCSSDGECCPSVLFVIDDLAITVMNNERGFLEKNIRALCDVGRSTKGKHKVGYIGQKGIGFKSVFRVTDRPEIHSNGFHICFDVHSGPTGYILPHWLPDVVESDDSWTTRIVLPLKESVLQNQTQSLAARFHDVHPSLLLFLHRLKHLTIINKVEDYTLKLQRLDLGNNIIEIRHNEAVDRWFVVRKMLDASNISAQAKSGVEVASTEVAMAFPLQSLENVQAQIQPEKQPVFAFLPLRSYGFRFVIQGDFDVPSSREEVDRDSLWNQWLRNELHVLFSDALQAFKEHEQFTELDAVCRFLQFVPLEDEILDFFRPVATQIQQHMKAQPCLPAMSSNKRLTWKLPSQLVLARDNLLPEVFPSPLLREHLGLDYLHPKVASVLNPTLMTSLGVQKMSLTHLLELRKAMISETAQQHNQGTKEAIIGTAKWLTCIYRAMDDFDNTGKEEEVIGQLRELPTIPLANDVMVSLSEKSVFFPPESKKTIGMNRLLLVLYQDLNSLHPDLLNCQDPVANSQVCNLLERLGVKRLQPHDIIHHHILPVLRDNNWQSKHHDLLAAYLIYIKEQLEQNKETMDLEELKRCAVVLTNLGPQKPADVPVHFTPAYHNKIDLAHKLPGYDWVLLDECYLAGSRIQGHIQSWHDFFSKLGVLNFLAFEPQEVKLTRNQLGESPWCDYKDILPPRELYVVKDIRSSQLEGLICANKQPETKAAQMAYLFNVLNELWETTYSARYTRTELCDQAGNVLKEVETSFTHILRTMPWIPAEIHSVIDGVPQVHISLLPGSHLFVPDKHIKFVLHNHVPYIHQQVSAGFAQFLGIRYKVTGEFVKDLLITWCERKDEANEEARVFNTPLNHMKYVYKYLYDNLTPKELQDLTHNYPVIFLTREENHSRPAEGIFLARHEVRWTDPSGLFKRHKDSLEDLDHEMILKKPELKALYGDMEDIFLKSMRVEEQPSLEHYTMLMLHISSTTVGGQNFTDILEILTILGRGISSYPAEQAGDLLDLQVRNIKELMKNKKCLLEKHKHKWVSLDDKPLLADNVQYERMFKDCSNVHILDCGEKSGANKMKRSNPASDVGLICTEAIRALYRAVGVKGINECVTVRSVTEMFKPCPSLQSYVREVIVYVQRVLAGEWTDVYNSLLSTGIKDKLNVMSFGQVNKLEMVYQLKDFPDDPPVIRNEECQIDDTQFIVHQDHVESYNTLNVELARFLSMGNADCFRHLKDVLNELYGELKRPNPDFQCVVDNHDIQMLPAEEPEWEVPEPMYYHPPRMDPIQPGYQLEQPMECHDSEQPAPPGEEACGLTAWPPNASMSGLKSRRGNAPKTSTMWPPPKPPEELDQSQLPANLRPSKYANNSDDAAKAEPKSANTTSVHHGAGISGVNTHVVAKPDVQIALPAGGDTISDSEVTDVEVTNHAATSADGDGRQGVTITSAPADGDGRYGVTMQRQESLVIEIGHSSGTPRYEQQYSHERHPRSQLTKKPVYFYGPPVWTAEADDAIYQDISAADLPILDMKQLDDGVDQFVIGEWGEALVNDYLHKLMAESDSNITAIKWMNETTEQGEPYDFIMTCQDGAGVQDYFIEVKSTLSGKKAFFEISAQQILFAQKAQEHYHLYRVFNAGKSHHVRLTKIENLAQMLNTKLIKLCMVV